MNLIFEEKLSEKIVPQTLDLYPGSTHFGWLLSDEHLLGQGGPEDIVWDPPEGVSRFSPSAFEQISIRHLLHARHGGRSHSCRGGLPPQAVLDPAVH